MNIRKRREYADELGKLAVYSFSKSIGSRFEEAYRQIGEDYLGLCMEVEKNNIDVAFLRFKVRELSNLVKSLKEKEGRR